MLRLSRARLLAAGSAGLVAVPAIVRSQQLEKIRLAGVPTDDLTPFFYALRNGWYQQAGLDVEFIATASGTAATAAIVAGAYEMGKGSLIASFVAHLRGLPLVLVANQSVWDRKAPFSLNVVPADSPLRTGADCNGKTAATAALNDLAQLGVVEWVDKNGGDSTTLKWVEIPLAAAEAALEEHRTDLGSFNEPVLSAALQSGKVRVLGDGLSEVGDRYVFGAFFAQPDWAAKHAPEIKKWVQVTYEAAAYTNAHRVETVAMMSELTKIPAETFRRMARAEGATSSDPALIQPLIDAAAKYKFIARVFPAREIYFNG